MVLPKPVECMQWNARGLTKSKLSEFKQFLSLEAPDVVLISESHWSDSFLVGFRHYHVLK